MRSLKAVPGLPDLLLAQYGKSKRFGQRASCVYHAMFYAKASKSALALGVAATSDKSKVVRYRAAMLLAIAQSASALPALTAMKAKFSDTAADADAAIRAIEGHNPNWFVDRDRTGLITLNVANVDG
jgi:hypothetical protein